MTYAEDLAADRNDLRRQMMQIRNYLRDGLRHADITLKENRRMDTFSRAGCRERGAVNYPLMAGRLEGTIKAALRMTGGIDPTDADKAGR